MTCDMVALVRNQPEVPTVVEGMIAFGESIEMRTVEDGVIHLYDPDGRLLVSIEVPVLVQVAGESERLLGPEMAGRVRTPTWWLAVRASPGVPDAERVAKKFADDIVHWQGGAVWPGPPVDPSPPLGGGAPEWPRAAEQSPNGPLGGPMMGGEERS